MKKVLVILAVLLLILGGALLFILNHLLQPERVRSTIADELAKVWTGRVSVGSASVSLPPSISVHDISLETSDGKQRLVGLGTFRLVPRLGPLLEGKVVFEKILLASPYASLVTDKDGALLISKHLKIEKAPTTESAPKETTTTTSSYLSGILIENIEISDARVTLPQTTGKALDLGPLAGSFSVTVVPSLNIS